jgi:hypothetical protein
MYLRYESWLGCSCCALCLPPTTGRWRGLEVAIKVVSFKNNEDEGPTSSTTDTAAQQKKRAVMEAAVCASIVHDNVVATYAHEIVSSAVEYCLLMVVLLICSPLLELQAPG